MDKCPRSVVDAIRLAAALEWSVLTTAWRNEIRYWSEDALHSHFRSLTWSRRLRTGRDPRGTVLKARSGELVDAARTIHNKGNVLWASH